MSLRKLLLFANVLALFNDIATLKILFLLPYNGTSHHVFFSPLIEELATRNHEVTVVNYLSMKNMTTIKQISLQDPASNQKRNVVMREYFKQFPNFLRDFFLLMENLHAQKEMATTNCEKIFSNTEILRLIKTKELFDIFIIEQFYSDCGLAWAKEIGVPIIGITAHILMPWTYSRLGVPNNPAFVPSRIGYNSLWARVKAICLNIYSNFYFRNSIQRTDHSIASKVLPDTPDLESIARNLSLVMVNQYFPLTGSRIYAPNIVEIGGMHVRMLGIHDEELLQFIESAKNGVVLISFGSVACGLPDHKVQAILDVVANTSLHFVWKVDKVDSFQIPTNLMMREWLPQVDILCHKNIKVFITHSGMLSSVEAIHCGVPLISVPIFGDQFANAQSARDIGLGITLDFDTLDFKALSNALELVLQESYQSRAKELSVLWRDRPMQPLETAVYWIEYVARHKGAPQLRPPTVNLPLYQYLMIDVWLILGGIMAVMAYLQVKIWRYILRWLERKKVKYS